MYHHIPLIQQIRDNKTVLNYIWPIVLVSTIVIWMLTAIGALTVIHWWLKL